MVEKRHRVEDALEAVGAAQLEGVLPGGASFLAQQSTELGTALEEQVENSWQKLGVEIVQDAILEPLKQMAKNAGESVDLIVDQVVNDKVGHGYDFKLNKTTNLLEAGIIDPARVTRCALQNSVSVAGTLITSNYAIVAK